MNQNTNTLTRLQVIAYSLPMLSFAFLIAPASYVLQGIYAKNFGVALTTIATVLLVSRLFDAITDPIIGYYSDQYYNRYGHRKPFIIVGVVLFIISCWFLYVPVGIDSEQGQTSVSTGYFLVCFLAFYLTQTLFEIPHMAWGSELSASSQEKTTTYSLRSLSMFLGALLFLVMPFLPWFDTTEFTPQTLKWSVIVAGAMMLLMLYLCLKHTPNKPTLSPTDNTNQLYRRGTLKTVFQTVLGNRPFLILTAAHMCTGIGYGMWISLLFIFVDTYLHLGSEFAKVFLIAYCLKITSLRLWFLMANRWGKKITWITGMVLVIAGTVGIRLLSPEDTGWIALTICMILVLSGFAAFSVMVPSLLSDIVDYDIWKSGKDRTATYFSLYCFINKAMGALGAALSLAIAGWLGFNPAATSHSDTAIVGLHLGMTWIPTLFILLSIVFIAIIPITTRRHAIIRQRLDSRYNRAIKPPQDLNEELTAGGETGNPSPSPHLLQT